MTTTDCTTDYGEYERYSDDRLFHGAGLKIDRSVYYKGDCDISDLITKSAKEVENLRDESIGKENAAYEKVLQAVAEWEKSPVIPDIDKSHFCVNGVLLPGYTTVSMQKEKEKKASIRKQLNELKADKPTEQKQLKARTKEVSI